MRNLLAIIWLKVRTEPVAVRTGVAAALAGLSTNLDSLVRALGVDASSFGLDLAWVADNEASVEKVIGSLLMVLVWLGPAGARKRVKPMATVEAEGGEVWGLHGE